MEATVCIVLATRNGAAFLPQQLDSLRLQTFEDWRLLVRDDGSTDETPEILRGVLSADERIELLPPAGGPAGNAARSFGILLEEAAGRGFEHVFCCDQDDAWEAEKLERVLPVLVEAGEAGRVPCLVHHDLSVVDAGMKPLADSYWSLTALRPGSSERPQRLLSRNEVTGCAMACNRALLERALPLPASAIMHDWWLALHAAYAGRLVPLPETLVRYRQHGGNVIGARSYRAGLKPAQNWFRNWRRGNDEFLATVRQARAFRSAMAEADGLDAGPARALEAYAALPDLGRLDRLRALRVADVWRGNRLLDAVLALRMLALRRGDAD